MPGPRVLPHDVMSGIGGNSGFPQTPNPETSDGFTAGAPGFRR